MDDSTRPGDAPEPEPSESPEASDGPAVSSPGEDLRPASTRIAPREIRSAVTIVLGWAVVGLLAGVAWSGLAPHVGIIASAAGPQLEDPTAGGFFTDDLVFAGITGLLGILGGAGGWTLRRYRGPVMLLAVLAGAALCAVITWRIGRQIGLSGFRDQFRSAPPGARVLKPVALASHSWLAVQPFFAALAYLVPAAWTSERDLGRERRSSEPDGTPDIEPTTAEGSDQLAP